MEHACFAAHVLQSRLHAVHVFFILNCMHSLHALLFSPPELHHFADHLKGLNYADTPDYELLENCLLVAMKRLGIAINDPLGLSHHYQ